MAAAITKAFDRSVIEDLTNPLRKRFLFFRANYFHLFGAPEGGDYWPVFQRHLAFKQQAPAQYELKNLTYAMNNYRVVDDSGSFELATQRAVMVSSFHYGPYNLLAGILSNEGVRFAILANGAEYYNQMRAYQQQQEKALKLGDGARAITDSDIIDPRDFTTMIKMMHKVKEGKSLLVYADGLEGQGGYFDRSRLATVPFLGKEIYARKGTAVLAYKLKIPIVIAVMEQEENGFVARSFPALDPKDFASQEAFATAYCQKGYEYLASYVRRAPELWEIFDRLHIWLPGEGAVGTEGDEVLPDLPKDWAPPAHCRYDRDRFDVFVEEGNTFLLDMHRRKVISVSSGLAQLLERVVGVERAVIREVLPEELLRDMFKKGVLIPDEAPEEILAA